jgi:hypothetical protein
VGGRHGEGGCDSGAGGLDADAAREAALAADFERQRARERAVVQEEQRRVDREYARKLEAQERRERLVWLCCVRVGVCRVFVLCIARAVVAWRAGVVPVCGAVEHPPSTPPTTLVQLRPALLRKRVGLACCRGHTQLAAMRHAPATTAGALQVRDSVLLQNAVA